MTRGGLGGAEAAALQAVDAARIISDLQALIAIPSLGGTPAEEEAQGWMAGALVGAGAEVGRWPLELEALSRHPDFAVEVEREGVTGVVADMGRGEGPTLVLNGHVDVVPPGPPALWSVDPWGGELRDGRVWGRGTADMKGALACVLAAVRALREAGIVLKGRLRVQSVVGEEDGGVGTLAALLRGYGGDLAVVLEPTRLAVAPASAGCLNVRLVVPGRGAHGALRHEGVSALEAFRPLHDALLELEARRNLRGSADPRFPGLDHPVPLSLGVVRGGVWASSVLEELVLEGRYGVLPDESPEEARRELEAAVARASEADPWLRDHPPRVEWWGGRFRPAGIPPGHPLVVATLAAVRDANPGIRLPDPPIQGVPYGSDVGLLSGVGGIPSVVFGPGDVRLAHAVDESVEVAELEACARALVLLAIRICGTV